MEYSIFKIQQVFLLGVQAAQLSPLTSNYTAVSFCAESEGP